jgi:hypothetical protein
MSLPKSVKTALRSLDPQTVKTYRRELRSSQKSLVFGFILWLLFGFHYLYLRRPGTQFFFWITLGGFGLWWLLDLLRLPGLIRNHNHNAARVLLAQHLQFTQIP